MKLPSWLLHRFVLVPLILAVVVAGWNAYVVAHADGVIEGRVLDPAGKPVAGAEVAFFERNMLNYEERRQTRTDAAGTYRFENMQVHIGQLEARTADGRKSERIQLRLWFRAQHTDVPALVVRG